MTSQDTSSKTPIIVWFRQDLRLVDQPALHQAARTGRPVIPVYIWAPHEEGAWAPGAASRWWLHHSLQALGASLDAENSSLIIRQGDSLAVLQDLIEETGASAVFWNRRYEPAIIARDMEIKATLAEAEIEAKSFNSALLYEPGTILNKAGTPFKVYTPFYKTILRGSPPAEPLPAPKKIPAPKTVPQSLELDALELLPTLDWAAGFDEAWTPGEAGADAMLESFMSGEMINYVPGRNFPAKRGTSRMSPHLHFGEISPRTVWYRVKEHISVDSRPGIIEQGEQYLRQLVWREFAYQLMFHFPHTPEQPLRDQFLHFPWRKDPKQLKAWQRGMTGYPIVDAGMRELWHTGWMHNRVRMIVGSFLVKHQLITWEEGASWFWDTLVDADLANNTLGWQWIGGCGADAAPYFRIFNPMTQGEKFDGAGDYVRKWIPELTTLPIPFLFSPWEAPTETLRAAGIVLGSTYPLPVVDHKAGRERALNALSESKELALQAQGDSSAG